MVPSKKGLRPWLGAFLCLLLMTAIGCSRLTQENFNKVQEGMSMAEVIAILGEPTDAKSAGVGPLSATTATWEDDTARINIKFLNDKVQLKKRQSKLTDSGDSGG